MHLCGIKCEKCSIGIWRIQAADWSQNIISPQHRRLLLSHISINLHPEPTWFFKHISPNGSNRYQPIKRLEENISNWKFEHSFMCRLWWSNPSVFSHTQLEPHLQHIRNDTSSWSMWPVRNETCLNVDHEKSQAKVKPGQRYSRGAASRSAALRLFRKWEKWMLTGSFLGTVSCEISKIVKWMWICSIVSLTADYFICNTETKA